jgi:hypothetical protein
VNTVAAKQKLMVAMRKPKKKFANARQKHHYVEAARHYHSYREATTNGDEMKADDHIDAFKLHAKHGKLNEFHRDQLQHDAKHFGHAKTRFYTPFKPKKNKKMVIKALSRKQKAERHAMFQKQMNAGIKSGERMRAAMAAGKTGQVKRQKKRLQWHVNRAKRHASKIGIKLK